MLVFCFDMPPAATAAATAVAVGCGGSVQRRRPSVGLCVCRLSPGCRACSAAVRRDTAQGDGDSQRARARSGSAGLDYHSLRPAPPPQHTAHQSGGGSRPAHRLTPLAHETRTPARACDASTGRIQGVGRGGRVSCNYPATAVMTRPGRTDTTEVARARGHSLADTRLRLLAELSGLIGTRRERRW